ncbi:MAG: hypothetical protein M3065_22200 [Actinomycetota bacterium]|nr:hypothetical protein [Actinomycetota bacterium]
MGGVVRSTAFLTAPDGCSAQYIADRVPPMPAQAHVGILLVGNAPVDEEDVESVVEEELDERYRAADRRCRGD